MARKGRKLESHVIVVWVRAVVVVVGVLAMLGVWERIRGWVVRGCMRSGRGRRI